MATTSQWILELIDRITAPLDKATEAANSATEAVDKVDEVVENLGKTSETVSGKMEKLGKGMFFLNQIKEGVDNVRGAFNEAIEPGAKFQYAMAQVQAIAGLTDDKVELVADKARDLAKAFGVNAAEGTGVFTNILSQLGPELANYPEVLDAMGRNAMTLSKTMDGDVKGAIDALTTSFNAFEISMDDPVQAAIEMEKQMNIIAKSAQIGAAEVPDIAQSLSTVGKSAKNAGVSFFEANAALQVFGQSTIKGSEAGTALRNIMIKISAPSNDAAKMMEQLGVNMEQLQNKSLPLADRLQALVPIMHDDMMMSKLFGLENIVAAQTLIGSTEQLKQWTNEVQNSTSATDQAAIIMNTYEERQKRMQATIDDLKISFFEFVEPIAPVLEIVGILTGGIVTLGVVCWSVGNIMSMISIKTAVLWVASMTKMVFATVTSASAMTAAISSIPIVGWIAIAVTLIGSLVAYLWTKFGEVRAFFYGLWNFIKVIFTEFYTFIFNVMKAIWEVINPANWFDDNFHFSDVWDKLSQQAVEGGKRVGSAFSDGWKEGMADWDKSRSQETSGKETGKLKLDSPLSPVNQTTPTGGGTGGTSGGGKKAGLGGNGNGNVRNVTMNVTFTNHFQVAGNGKVREIADTVKRELLAVLTDAVPAIG